MLIHLTTLIFFQPKFYKTFYGSSVSSLSLLMPSSLSYSEVIAAVNGFKHSSSPKQAQASENFLHLQFFKHPFTHSHLVSSNRAVWAGKLNSHAIVPISPCKCLCFCAAEAQWRLCSSSLIVCRCDNCIKSNIQAHL